MAHRTILQPRSRLTSGGSGSSSRQPSNPYASTQQARIQQPIPYAHRTLEEQQRINAAAHMREENELLVWKSLERNESVPQTKLHYERDMLFIDSDDEANGRREDDEAGGSGGSVEWEEDHVWDSDDAERMKPGVRFGPDGWYNPTQHGSVEERLRDQAERRTKAEVGSGKARVKAEEASPRQGSPRSGVKKSGRTPGQKRASSGKKPFGSSASGSQS